MPLSNWALNGFGWPSSTTGAASHARNENKTSMPGSWDSEAVESDSQPDRTSAFSASNGTPRARPVILADDEDVDDTPPAFPALNSIQRSGNSSSSSAAEAGDAPTITLHVPELNLQPPDAPLLGDAKLMPPPLFLPPRFTTSSSSSSNNGSSPSRTPASNRTTTTPSPSLLAPLVTSSVPANTNTKNKARAKVALTPGHSPLDWARLKSSGEDLRCGITELMPITPSELKEHRTRNDAWAAFYGKVYNITPYLPFHPGGEKELMRTAGRDGTTLFALTHSWVNLDFMLDGCMIGFLVPEIS